jgi:hypothetical protein
MPAAGMIQMRPEHQRTPAADRLQSAEAGPPDAEAAAVPLACGISAASLQLPLVAAAAWLELPLERWQQASEAMALLAVAASDRWEAAPLAAGACWLVYEHAPGAPSLAVPQCCKGGVAATMLVLTLCSGLAPCGWAAQKQVAGPAGEMAWPASWAPALARSAGHVLQGGIQEVKSRVPAAAAAAQGG